MQNYNWNENLVSSFVRNYHFQISLVGKKTVGEIISREQVGHRIIRRSNSESPLRGESREPRAENDKSIRTSDI